MVEPDDRVVLLTRKQAFPGKVVDLWIERLKLPGGATTELDGAVYVLPSRALEAGR